MTASAILIHPYVLLIKFNALAYNYLVQFYLVDSCLGKITVLKIHVYCCQHQVVLLLLGALAT